MATSTDFAMPYVHKKTIESVSASTLRSKVKYRLLTFGTVNSTKNHNYKIDLKLFKDDMAIKLVINCLSCTVRLRWERRRPEVNYSFTKRSPLQTVRSLFVRSRCIKQRRIKLVC